MSLLFKFDGSSDSLVLNTYSYTYVVVILISACAKGNSYLNEKKPAVFAIYTKYGTASVF